MNHLTSIDGGNVKKQIGDRQIYPISPRAVSYDSMTRGNRTEIENTVEGGMTLREHVAIQFVSSMLANPTLVAQALQANNGVHLIIQNSVKYADDFLKVLDETE